jgi:hypothetical protein
MGIGFLSYVFRVTGEPFGVTSGSLAPDIGRLSGREKRRHTLLHK